MESRWELDWRGWSRIGGARQAADGLSGDCGRAILVDVGGGRIDECPASSSRSVARVSGVRLQVPVIDPLLVMEVTRFGVHASAAQAGGAATSLRGPRCRCQGFGWRLAVPDFSFGASGREGQT